jgi:hypothetical protein
LSNSLYYILAYVDISTLSSNFIIS